MIFVTVGSQKFQFNRLLKAIDELIENGKITDEVFAQSGASDYKPKNYLYKEFMDRDEFKKIMSSCDIVITHGGTGVIVGAIKIGKKVIAVPRLSKFDEHIDDHQLQLIGQFTKSNLISCCRDVENLDKAIEDVKKHVFAKYESNTDAYINTIRSYISGLNDK